MLNKHESVLEQLALGWAVVLCFVLVGYLIRLKISELRKRRRMALKAERFGLIQEITATGTSIANVTSQAVESQSVMTIVPRRDKRADKRAKRWTRPAGFPATGFQWN